jgi:ribonuclease Z
MRNGEAVEVTPDQVLGSPRSGRAVVYTGDTRPIYRQIGEIAQGADLLIHDATFEDADADRAREVYHSTAGEAGEVAAALGVQRLALVHISSRYTSAVNHVRDAKKKYSGEVTAPSDLTVIELPFREGS